jgi:circadian clock protein KaiB
MPDLEATGASSRSVVRLRLFVAANSAMSALARRQFQELLARTGAARIEAEIVDVFEQPQLAEEARVLATPMLIRPDPPPGRSIIGDLGDQRTVVAVLGLDFIDLPGDPDAGH